MDSPDRILKALKKSNRILIPLHVNPDGDAIGSALALQRVLISQKKKVDVVSADPVPKCFLALPEAKKIRHVDPADLDLSSASGGYDLLAVLDIGSLSRISRDENLELPRALTVVNIDHHLSNDNFTKLKVVKPQASSTAEVLFNLFEKWGFAIDRNIAVYLLIGIVTDTGGFRYDRTSADSMEKAAKLIRVGANYSAAVDTVFRNWSPAALSFWEKALQKRTVAIGGRLIYTTLTQEEIKKTGIKPHEISNTRSFVVSDIFRAIKNVDVAAIFSEECEGKIHGSLRSKLGFDVSKIAKKMEGGGHAHSAAFDIKGKMGDVVDKTVALIEDVLK